MNKQIFGSVMAIVAVAAVAIGGTYAAWTATASISDNTVSTAQLSITATAEGKSSPVAAPLPFNAKDLFPGDVTDPELRAVITNNSTKPMKLYMYLEGDGGDACYATKLAWQSSHLGSSVQSWGGYSTIPANPGTIAGDGDTNFKLVYPTLWGESNRVLIAPAAEFGPDAKIAVRQVVGFATDADNSYQDTSCKWTLHFVAEM